MCSVPGAGPCSLFSAPALKSCRCSGTALLQPQSPGQARRGCASSSPSTGGQRQLLPLLGTEQTRPGQRAPREPLSPSLGLLCQGSTFPPSLACSEQEGAAGAEFAQGSTNTPSWHGGATSCHLLPALSQHQHLSAPAIKGEAAQNQTQPLSVTADSC